MLFNTNTPVSVDGGVFFSSLLHTVIWKEMKSSCCVTEMMCKHIVMPMEQTGYMARLRKEVLNTFENCFQISENA